VRTDIGFPTCNPIIHVNLKPEQSMATRYTDCQSTEKKNHLHCWTTQNTRPSNMGEYLAAHGFMTQEAAPAWANRLLI